jgi:hypothetical protein
VNFTPFSKGCSEGKKISLSGSGPLTPENIGRLLFGNGLAGKKPWCAVSF